MNIYKEELMSSFAIAKRYCRCLCDIFVNDEINNENPTSYYGNSHGRAGFGRGNFRQYATGKIDNDR